MWVRIGTALMPLLIALVSASQANELALEEIDTDNSASWEEDNWSADDSWEETGISADIPVVLTATRLRQSQLDTPASVTIIEADLIERMGVRNIEEIFRMVPGMLVANDGVHGGKQTTVTYHGTQVAEHRRLQVLIDGRSVYKPALPSVPRVSWTDLPLAIEDIQRIEVIRGPNSAAYGANSYLAIINILTKKPEDIAGHRAKITQGTNGIHDYYVSTSGKGPRTYFRATVSGKADKGFDSRIFEDSNDVEQEGHHRDSRDIDQFTFRSTTEWNANWVQEFQFGHKTGTNQQRDTEASLTYITPQDLDVDDSFIWTRVTQNVSSKHTIQYQANYQHTDRVQEWRWCLGAFLIDSAAGNGAAEALGFSNEDYCGDSNYSGYERRTDIEIQDIYEWSNNLRTVAGIRWRQEDIESETFLGNDPLSNKTHSLFANIEYKLSEASVINAGASWEDEDETKDFLAPRFAFNQHIGDNQVVRFIYSEAVRSPNMYEQQGQEVYTLRNVEYSDSPNGGIAAFIQGAGLADLYLNDTVVVPNLEPPRGELSHEKIKSHEISYFALLADGHWQLDAKWFYDELTDLISEPLGDNNKALTNETALVLEGFETQIKWMPVSSDEIYVSYAYINPKDEKNSSEDSSSVKKELRLMAQHSGSLSWLHQWSPRTSSSLSYFWVDQWNYTFSKGPYNFERIDANLSHQLTVTEDVDLRLSATVEYRVDDDPLLWQENVYQDKEKYFVSAELKF